MSGVSITLQQPDSDVVVSTGGVDPVALGGAPAMSKTLHANNRLNVLILPDKFKGTLTAREAAQAIAAGWRHARPDDSLCLLPISDGGDGFGEVLGSLLDGQVQTIATMDAAHRPCKARWWWVPGTKTAILESAEVVGLAMLEPKKIHPFALDTFGLGAVLAAAIARGAKHCLMGIGGSATNDGGFGLARALGWEFLDRQGHAIEQWIHLRRLAHIRAPQGRRRLLDLVVAVDVQNPLLGPRGATRVYGPQKGLCSGDFGCAESCLRRLAEVVKAERGCDSSLTPGAGAAGGLGFGLLAFAGGRLEAGFDLFARRAALAGRLKQADLVITGEGAIDCSTLMGKGVGEIARDCARRKIPCIGLAGTAALPPRSRAFARLLALTNLTTPDQAQSRAAFWLKRLAEQAAREWH
jgi:glycerate 2-kinase